MPRKSNPHVSSHTTSEWFTVDEMESALDVLLRLVPSWGASASSIAASPAI